MSGGVDSSVAAALLVERGVEAVGVTMKLLPRAETGFGCCGSPADVDDARRVCEKLGISHYVVDMAELFESKLPVGSSHNSKLGKPTIARAMATRCCSPPDNLPGEKSTRWLRPTRSSAVRARSSRPRAD